MGIGVSPSIIEVALFHRFITDTRILLCSLHLSWYITALQAWKATRARIFRCGSERPTGRSLPQRNTKVPPQAEAKVHKVVMIREP